MPEQDVTVGQLLLVEYQSVKDEQKARIGFRDNLLYVTLAVVAAAIGAYVRGDLGPRLADLAQIERSAAFGWERAHRADARRTSRKAIQCGVDLLAFCAVPLAGLVVYWAGGQVGRGLLVLSVLEALVVVGLAVQVVLYAGVFGSGRR